MNRYELTCVSGRVFVVYASNGWTAYVQAKRQCPDEVIADMAERAAPTNLELIDNRKTS